MKNSRLIFCFLSFIISSVIFSSCINFERKININPDGSGTEKMTIEYSREFFVTILQMLNAVDSTKMQDYVDSLYNDSSYARQTHNKFNDAEGVKLIGFESRTNPDSSKTMVVEYSFENIKYIGNSFDNSYISGKNLENQKTDIFFRDEGDKVIFNYYFKTGDSSTTSMKEGISEYFKGKKLIFDIIFPYDIVSSNATYTKGRNLIWEYDMGYIYMEMNEMKLEAVMKK